MRESEFEPEFFFRDTDVTMARHKYVFTCWFVITITMLTVDFKRITETSRINNSDLRKGGIGPTIRSSEKWKRIIKSMCCEKAKTRMMTMLGTSTMTSLWTRMMTIWGREQEDGKILSEDDDKDVNEDDDNMRSRTRRWQDFERGWWQGWWQWGREQEDGTEEALRVRGD